MPVGGLLAGLATSLQEQMSLLDIFLHILTFACMIFASWMLYRAKRCMKLVLSDKEKKKHVVELGFVKGMITGVPSMTYLTSESVGCILRNAENINEMCHGTIIGDKAVVFHM